MVGAFTLFPLLPPEIRQQIWQHSQTENWSFTQFRSSFTSTSTSTSSIHPYGVNISWRRDPSLRQACREARLVLQLTHQWTEPFGWTDFSHHLFFFQDEEKIDGSVLKQAVERYGTLSQVQHIVLHPQSFWRLKDTFELVHKHCPYLRTIMVVGPWMELPPRPWSHKSLQLSLFFDGERIYHDSPTVVDPTALFAAISCESAYAAERTRRAEYRARLDEVLTFLEDEDWAWNHILWILRRVEAYVEEMPSAPRLFLCRGNELCPPALRESQQSRE